MKIIEALKEFPLIEKKLIRNNATLLKYSSGFKVNDKEYLECETAKDQKDKVLSTLQSTEDLLNRRAYLRRCLALTNATTKITIDGNTLTILEWLEMRQRGIPDTRKALNSLSKQGAQIQADTIRRNLSEITSFDFIMFFDENDKKTTLEEIEEMETKIDHTLETFNATNDLLEPSED